MRSNAFRAGRHRAHGSLRCNSLLEIKLCIALVDRFANMPAAVNDLDCRELLSAFNDQHKLKPS
jgi:hypothetical protein